MEQMDYPLIRHCTLGPSLNRIGLPSAITLDDWNALSNDTGYNKNILSLLDGLGCPLLLLPQLKNGDVIRHIGFFTDIRFLGIATLMMLAKIASAFQADIIVLNIAEQALPEMEHAYAKAYFSDKGMTVVNGLKINLINITKHITKRRLSRILADQQIDMLAAMQARKDLLYKMAG